MPSPLLLEVSPIKSRPDALRHTLRRAWFSLPDFLMGVARVGVSAVWLNRCVESVQLTQGEVDHARSWQPTDLFVVDELVVGPGEAESAFSVSGGRVRLGEGWQPADSHLRPTHLRYSLPEAR